MTVITAVRKAGIAAIAADRQTSQGSTIVPGAMQLGAGKIHHVADSYVGIVGNTAHHSVLRSLWARQPELFDFHSVDAIFETFRAIQPVLRDDYFLETKEDDDDQEYESNQMAGLIVSRAGVFSFFSYREITEYNSFWAAGTGTEYALGAMEAVYGTRRGPLGIAEAGVQAACKFDTHCGLPLESYEVELAMS